MIARLWRRRHPSLAALVCVGTLVVATIGAGSETTQSQPATGTKKAGPKSAGGPKSPARDTTGRAAAVDTTSLEFRSAEQARRLAQQASRLDSLQILLDEQKEMLGSLNRRLDQVQGARDSLPPAGSLEERLRRLETTSQERPETPADVVSAGSFPDRKSTRLNSSHIQKSRMPSSA